MTRTERILRLLSLVSVVAGCGVVPAPLPPPTTGEPCQAAETRLRELGCPEAELRPGRPFSAFCLASVDDGRNHHPECIARIRDCSEIDRAATGELCQ
jgi:hypothetical protein